MRHTGNRIGGSNPSLSAILLRAGKSPHTSKFLPWRLVTYVAFSDQSKAASFERYLKSGSGHAFANKRPW